MAKRLINVPFSLRLTFEERAKLEEQAAGMALGAYIRKQVFDGKTSPRKKRGKRPIKDHVALGRVLGALGQSRLPNNLNQLAKAVNSGSLPVTPDTEQAIPDACDAIEEIRADLFKALGTKPGGME